MQDPYIRFSQSPRRTDSLRVPNRTKVKVRNASGLPSAAMWAGIGLIFATFMVLQSF